MSTVTKLKECDASAGGPIDPVTFEDTKRQVLGDHRVIEALRDTERLEHLTALAVAAFGAQARSRLCIIDQGFLLGVLGAQFVQARQTAHIALAARRDAA